MISLQNSELRYSFTESLTFRIIIANAVIWVIQLLGYPLVNAFFALKPSLALSGQIYQFFTYMFLHATYVQTAQGLMIYPYHIAIYMLILAIFGFPLEQTIGRKRFITVYVVSGVGSAVFYLMMMAGLMGVYDTSLIGASGAVFGVLAAYAFKYHAASTLNKELQERYLCVDVPDACASIHGRVKGTSSQYSQGHTATYN